MRYFLELYALTLEVVARVKLWTSQNILRDLAYLDPFSIVWVAAQLPLLFQVY